MSDPDQNPNDRPAGGPARTGWRRARILIPLGILLVVVLIFAYILLVAQVGAEDDSTIYQQDDGSAPVSLLGGPEGALGLC